MFIFYIILGICFGRPNIPNVRSPVTTSNSILHFIKYLLKRGLKSRRGTAGVGKDITGSDWVRIRAENRCEELVKIKPCAFSRWGGGHGAMIGHKAVLLIAGRMGRCAMVFLVTLEEVLAINGPTCQGEIAHHQERDEYCFPGLKSGPVSKKDFHKKYIR